MPLPYLNTAEGFMTKIYYSSFDSDLSVPLGYKSEKCIYNYVGPSCLRNTQKLYDDILRF